ncbi:thioredoxin [Actinoplanes sp. SE50]|uniref:thioredoxin domain-containing protein n=1 Tax=unclassified Actinoplanes TaxID=2626549 RepID=UPI00023EC1F7|nr:MULTISPECIES: thioredoxin domain-containing protein [unclassified Actinoplanes]AEV81871.1 Spermatogenesis-associated protein 20 [Actinoplanes sp. SE50/110]ATO80272.1 thioredoxin [Actinoplanes sp. SE50]SLL97677.1 thioredoxin [Actinoplanes sp. SE50/110]
MANRLANATSPYLQQHRDNPVDWWEWSAEAFAEARRREVPVLISVGYAACHWCHVMAHESFEDDAVAAQLNADFVAIKVDREERPDVDAVYMTATQAMTGQGGWPMTVFATPDGDPFYCGTYFPKQQFTRLLTSVTAAWRDERDGVLKQGAAVVQAVGGAQAVGGPVAAVTAEMLAAAAAGLAQEHDQTYGGFGGAPKFPPHMNLLFLLRHLERTGSAEALELVRHTAERMARGGIYDQLAGGFARYAVDEHWTVPHFEKMLYDNALLLRVYTQLWRLTGDVPARRVADETAEFLLRDLATPAGGLASALDADTDGVEGLTYAWTPAELTEVLGPDDGAWAADLFRVTPDGTFEHGRSVLVLARDIDAADPALVDRWRDVRARLLDARGKRPQPARDDKVVASWNGLAITALAEHGALTGSTASREAAVALAGVLADRHLIDGRLRRVSRDGVVGDPAGVLEDYGCVAEAFLAVHQITADPRWSRLAGRLLDVALARFGTGSGGFYDTADDAEKLVTRPADPTDNATPSGLAAVCAALVTYAALTGETRYRDAADAALATAGPLIGEHPRFAGYSAMVAEAALTGPYEIAVATDDLDDPLVIEAVREAPAGSVVVAGPPDLAGVPLLADRPMIDGRPTAYICRGFVCDRPVTTPKDLLARLRS